MAPPTSASDRRQQFFTAIKNAKLDAVRWALTHGGQNPGTRDDEGYTAIMTAAAANKPKVLQLMLDICRRSRELELIDLRDGQVRRRGAVTASAARRGVHAAAGRALRREAHARRRVLLDADEQTRALRSRQALG